MEIKDIIALLLGAIGSVLGVVNFVRSIMDERVRLRVTPRLAWQFDGGVLNASSNTRIREIIESSGLPNIGIEVLNLSKFPVVIDEVGLCEGTTKIRRAPFFKASTLDGACCSIKIASHESVNLYSVENIILSYPFTSNTRGYATTSCDHVAVGRSEALDEWAEMVDDLRKRSQKPR